MVHVTLSMVSILQDWLISPIRMVFSSLRTSFEISWKLAFPLVWSTEKSMLEKSRLTSTLLVKDRVLVLWTHLTYSIQIISVLQETLCNNIFYKNIWKHLFWNTLTHKLISTWLYESLLCSFISRSLQSKHVLEISYILKSNVQRFGFISYLFHVKSMRLYFHSSVLILLKLTFGIV